MTFRAVALSSAIRIPLDMLPTVTNILGKVPDSYQRQNRGKNHEQTNRSPLGIWILHILLLEVGGRERAEPPEMLSNSTPCVAIALLLSGRALNYQSSFFRVNQIIPRHNNSQAIHPIPR